MPSRRDSDFARLEQLLQEERRNRQEADERAEQERRRAEDERRNRQEAESRAQIEGKKTRPTTFEEYIRACTSLETTSYPDRQKPQHTGLHHQPQEQAMPHPFETLDRLSDSTTTALRKGLRIYPS
jgi:hypothetical protein